VDPRVLNQCVLQPSRCADRRLGSRIPDGFEIVCPISRIVRSHAKGFVRTVSIVDRTPSEFFSMLFLVVKDCGYCCKTTKLIYAEKIDESS
jgi:hypothetical protein